MISALYGSVGRGGGTGDIGQAREFLIQHTATGNQNFDQIARWNGGLSNEVGLDDFPDYSYTTRTGNTGSGRILSKQGGGIIKRASMNEHQWYGLLSNITTDLSDNLTFTGGVDFRFYTGSHYRKTVDLLGGDFWFDRDDRNNRSDWVDFNADGVQGDDEMGTLVRPTNDAATTLTGGVPDSEKN